MAVVNAALVDAAAVGDLEIVIKMIEQDSTLVHAVDNMETPALVCAASMGHLEVARYLLDHGAM
eukprot:51872-Eustigmatos_ZCMA.PRE.1